MVVLTYFINKVRFEGFGDLIWLSDWLELSEKPCARTTVNLAAAERIEGCRRCISDLERLLGLDADPAADGKRRMIQATLGRLAWPLKESEARKLLRELSG